MTAVRRSTTSSSRANLVLTYENDPSLTVRITVLNLAGAVLLARTTTGVTESSAGLYTYTISYPGVPDFLVRWDVGDASSYHQQSYSWWGTVSSTSITVRDLDPRIAPYNAACNGTTDDGAAINSALAAAATANVGVFIPGIVATSIPIENLTQCPIRGAGVRIRSGFKALAGFAHPQLLRNWKTTDWAAGETDHRTAPGNPALSGSHTLNHYPLIEDIDLDPGAASNVALLSWVGAQETGWINRVTMHGGTSSDTNKGTWGLDLQAGTVAGSAINGLRVGQLTLYQLGWDRQVTITGQGSDVYISDFTGGGGKAWTAVVYVDSVGAIKFGRFDLNSPADTGARAQFYLVNVFADFVIDELYVESTAMPSQKPMIVTANTVGGSTTAGGRRSAPVIREAAFYPVGGGPYYPNGFITDMYNTVPYDSGTIGTDTAAAFTQMSYDGYEIRATNIDGTRVRHSYKAST